MNGFKKLLATGLVLGFGHAAWAEQAPLILRDNVLTIPQAVIVDGDSVSHFRNIELAQDAGGNFTVVSAEDGSLANIESVEILRDDHRIDVLAKGWRSACVSIMPGAVSRKGNEFVIAIAESKPTGDVCIAVAIPFYTITRLTADVLQPGEYSVSVNGVKTDFTL